MIKDDIFDVKLSRKALKSLKKLPLPIAIKLYTWIEAVGSDGWHITKQRPGLHDEALRGKRKGQRSIRLSKSYRAIYIIKNEKLIRFLQVEEVNNHDY